jgi:hypothetical protein
MEGKPSADGKGGAKATKADTGTRRRKRAKAASAK